MGLLSGDLRMLANVPATAAGRRLALSLLTGLGLLGLMTWWGIGEVLARPQLRHLLHPTGDDPLRGLLGFGLGPCPIAATWLGLSLAQRQLFEAPELALWQAAPLPGWRPAVQVLLRATLLSTLWSAALAGPLLLALLADYGAPWTAYLQVLPAMLLTMVPLLATLLATQIVLVRFFAGRLLRLCFALASALASVGFSTWILLRLFSSPGERPPLLASNAGGDRLPWTLDIAAELLTSAARGEFATSAWLAGGGWLLAVAAGFTAVACLHPRAIEKHQSSDGRLWRRRGGRWPTSVGAAIRRKEFAQVLQQPGALIGFLVFAFLVVAMAQKQVLVGSILSNWRLPRDLAHLGAMAGLWFLAVLLVLYAHMGRLALWDGAQWSLYQSSPVRPAAILWGKLQAIAVFLLWPLLLVLGVGSQLFEASNLALAVYLALGLAGSLAALGVLAAVGTWPWLMRPDEGGQITQGGNSFLAALLLVLLFELAVAPAVAGWWWLTEWLRHHPRLGDDLAGYVPWLLGAAFAWSALVGGLGVLVGIRNYGRLLRAR